jgi:hypothetical protein
MSNPIVITRDTVSRPWAELDPKIAVALITGFLALIAVIVAHALGVKLPVEVYSVIPLSFAILCGYFTKGTGTTVTQFGPDGTKVSEETHHGPTVTTVSTPIQAPAPDPSVLASARAAAQAIPPATSFTETLNGTEPEDSKDTVVLPPTPGAAFFAARANQSSIDDH